jgi:hypothetical protein
MWVPQWKRKLPFGSSSTDTLLRKHWKLCVQKKKKEEEEEDYL